MSNPWDLEPSDLESRFWLLPPRERRIVRLRFGFGCRPRTLKTIGDKLGLSVERVRQLEGRALRRINRARIYPEIPPS